MSETSIQTAPAGGPTVPPPAAITTGSALPPPANRPQPKSRRFFLLKALASLRLTVVLFVLSLILVFVGTLAQMDESINSVVARYFRSFFVWVPFQLFARFAMVFFGLDKDAHLPGSFPFPGGWLLGFSLLINLLAAHLVRFKVSWKRSGILLIHSGLILMMLGELYTGLYAIEGNLTVRENDDCNFLEHRDHCQIAITSPADNGMDDVVVIPDSKFREGATIKDPLLPFDVVVNRFMPNSNLGVLRSSPLARELAMTDVAPQLADALPEDLRPLVDGGIGKQIFAVPAPKGVGVESKRHDIPSAYVTLLNKNTDKPIGSFFLSVWADLLQLNDEPVTVDGKTYNVALRFKRTYKPYSVHLYKVTTVYHPGTTKPKSFSSDIQLTDPTRGEEFKIKIIMNQPLRYHGETFFQSQVLGTDTTVLQVVKNESWLMPYLSCVVVSLGMLIHFSMNLSTFLQRRAK